MKVTKNYILHLVDILSIQNIVRGK